MKTDGRHTSILLLLGLAVAAAWSWRASLASPATLPDELVYLRAARHVAAGESPYGESGYFYPPPLARGLAAATASWGRLPSLRALRVASLLAIVLAVWWLLERSGWTWWARLVVGAAFVALAPAVGIATTLGNAAGLAVAPVLVGLATWRRRPVVAGLAIGIGLAVKPVAALALPLIAVHRGPPGSFRRRLAATLAGATGALVVCLPDPLATAGLLGNATGHTNPYNFSLHAVARDFGLALPPLLVFAAVTAAALWASRRRLYRSADLALLAVGASLLALPILWAHSLLLALPLQIRTVDRLTSSTLRGPTALLDLTAGLALVATLVPQAVGTGAGLPDWAGLAARTVTLLAIPFLTWFTLLPPVSGHAKLAANPRTDR